MDHNQPLSRSQCPSTLADITRMRNVPYHEAVGLLMYAMMGTRPDITFGMSMVTQFIDNLGWVHWEAVKRIFCYLKGTKDYELVYGGERKDLTGFVDADGASQEHRYAILGYVFMVDGGAVSWSLKKQELVTLLTMEAEYMAATHTAKEAIWLHRIMGELFLPLDEPTTLSMATISQQLHLHMVDNIMHAPNILISNIILSATSLKLVPSSSFTAQLMSKPQTC